MNQIMDKAHLLDALNAVLPFVSSRDIVEQYSTIHLLEDGIEATDGYNGIFYPLEIGKGVDSLVPGELFFKLIKSVRAKELNLKVTSSKVKVLTKKLIGEINCLHEDDVERMSFTVTKKRKFPKNFVECLKICRFGASSDQSLGCLVGVIVLKDTVYGIDRFSAVKAKLSKSLGLKIAIPIPLVNQIIKYKDQIQYYGISKTPDGVTQLTFVLDNGVHIFGNLLDVDFKKNIEETLEEGSQGSSVKLGVLPDEVLGALDRHLIIQQDVSEIDKRVLLEFEGKFVIVRSQSEKGKIKEKIGTKVAIKKPVQFVINPLLLKDFLPYKPKVIFFEESALILFIGDIFEYFIVGEIAEQTEKK